MNPADWTDIDYDGGYDGCAVGLDYAGIVILPSPTSTEKNFNKGDRVCGPVHGCNSTRREDGAFADYILVKAGLQMHVPEYMRFEEAATLGCGVLTIGQGLYQSLGLPLPSLEGGVEETGKWILIYGGSSATGTLAIQFAKLSGIKSLRHARLRISSWCKRWELMLSWVTYVTFLLPAACGSPTMTKSLNAI